MGHFSALYSIICQKTDFTGLYGEWETGQRLFGHNIESVTKVIKSKKILPNYFFSSFDISSLKFVKKNFPNSPRGFLIDNYSFYDKKDIVEICKELRCFCVGIDSNIANKNNINFFKKNKLKVNVYTINNLKFAKKLFLFGVNSIFTDRPDLVKF